MKYTAYLLFRSLFSTFLSFLLQANFDFKLNRSKTVLSFCVLNNFFDKTWLQLFDILSFSGRKLGFNGFQKKITQKKSRKIKISNFLGFFFR